MYPFSKFIQIIFVWYWIFIGSMPTSFAQYRFIKTFHNEKNYSEAVWRPVEIKGEYFLPITTGPSIDTFPNQFYILKLDNKGNLIKRKYFDNWFSDRGDLFERDNKTFWKISADIDTIDNFHFRFSIMDEAINELIRVKVPRTFPANGGPNNEHRYIKLPNGDFIFLLGVSAFNWKPYNREINGTNFIYITKDGVIKSNKTFGEYNALGGQNYIWQMSDTSIMTAATLNGCKIDCDRLITFDFNGNVIEIKQHKNGFLKKCGNRYYGFKEKGFGEKVFTCLNENFELLYEKPIPDEVYPYQFWYVGDNSDFRVRASWITFDDMGNPSGYETMMDTSFTWQKMKLFAGDANDGMKDINWLGEAAFYPTSDGGALYVFYKDIWVNYDNDIVIAKVDTGYTWCNNIYRENDKYVIYPNPNQTGQLFIERDYWQQIIVYDYTGTAIKQFNNPIHNLWDNIDVSDLKRGTYYLKISFPEKEIFNKFLKL